MQSKVNHKKYVAPAIATYLMLGSECVKVSESCLDEHVYMSKYIQDSLLKDMWKQHCNRYSYEVLQLLFLIFFCSM